MIDRTVCIGRAADDPQKLLQKRVSKLEELLSKRGYALGGSVDGAPFSILHDRDPDGSETWKTELNHRSLDRVAKSMQCIDVASVDDLGDRIAKIAIPGRKKLRKQFTKNAIRRTWV